MAEDPEPPAVTDGASDHWTTTVYPRGWIAGQQHTLAEEGLCTTGREHEFENGSCLVCDAGDPFYGDETTDNHPADTRDDHLCFKGCRHYRKK